MEPQLIIIDSAEGLIDLGRYLSDKTYITCDTETTGLSKHDIVVGISVCAESDKAYYVILHKWNNKTKNLVPTTARNRIEDILQILVSKKLIMHNGIFDCMMIESNFKINLINSIHMDTMIAAHLLNENDPVGLKDLGKQEFGLTAVKEQEEMKASVISNQGEWSGTNKEMYKATSEVLGKYGAKDALLTFNLFNVFIQKLEKEHLLDFFFEESMPLLRGPTYDMNTEGLQVNMDGLTNLQLQLEAEISEGKAYIHQQISNYIKDKKSFNMGSSQQLSWLLFGILKYEFSFLTDAGREVCKAMGLRLPYTAHQKKLFIDTCLANEGEVWKPEATVNGKLVKAKKVKLPWAYIKCDSYTINKLSGKADWIKVLLNVKKKEKLINTYVIGIQERIKYGIIQPSFLQHGTTSGRYSSCNPNFQNLPRDDKRIKACIVARPGKVFVGADYSQLDPRVFAYFSRDERLLEAFRGKDDFYSVIGAQVYKKFDCTTSKEDSPDSFKVKYKNLRDDIKKFALASVYGSTPNKLSMITGKSVEDISEDLNNYFEEFKGVKNFMLECHKKAKETGQVKSLFGRPRRIPQARLIEKIYGPVEHSELPYDVRSLLNLSVNHRIQSTGASIVNRSAIALYDAFKTAEIDCKFVVQVHDSIIIECKEADAEDVAILMQHCLENTINLKSVALEATPKIGKTLADV